MARAPTHPLRLTALDVRDLEIVSAAVQDAVVRMDAVALDPGKRRLRLAGNRFCWERAHAGGAAQRAPFALSLDSVVSVRSRGLARERADAVAALLAVRFEPDRDPPGGAVTLHFAGGGAIEAQVECLDVALVDLGPSRPARAQPDHGVSAPEDG